MSLRLEMSCGGGLRNGKQPVPQVATVKKRNPDRHVASAHSRDVVTSRRGSAPFPKRERKASQPEGVSSPFFTRIPRT